MPLKPSHNLLVRGSNPCGGTNQLTESVCLGVATLIEKRLFWLDDDYRIRAAVSVIFDGGVGRIVQTNPIDEEPVGVLARR